MELVQVNLVVSDLEASRAFYAALGFRFRARAVHEGDPPAAWVTEDGPLPLVLHSPEFARWWDPGSPGAVAGSAQLDLRVDSPEEQDRVLARAVEAGGAVVRPAEVMPWGQRFAVMTDPDGHRWGVKAPGA